MLLFSNIKHINILLKRFLYAEGMCDWLFKQSLLTRQIICCGIFFVIASVLCGVSIHIHNQEMALYNVLPDYAKYEARLGECDVASTYVSYKNYEYDCDIEGNITALNCVYYIDSSDGTYPCMTNKVCDNVVCEKDIIQDTFYVTTECHTYYNTKSSYWYTNYTSFSHSCYCNDPVVENICLMHVTTVPYYKISVKIENISQSVDFGSFDTIDKGQYMCYSESIDQDLYIDNEGKYYGDPTGYITCKIGEVNDLYISFMFCAVFAGIFAVFMLIIFSVMIIGVCRRKKVGYESIS